MLEKPNLDDHALIACLRDAFGVAVVDLAFLPLGNDASTAVYRAVAAGGECYFCKLRRDDFDEVSVMLPHFLHEQGIPQIIAPLPTLSGELWAFFDPFFVILYPFVEGSSGYDVGLTLPQWAEFGAAMRAIHSTLLPPAILQRIEKEQFSAQWRTECRGLMARIQAEEQRAEEQRSKAVVVGNGTEVSEREVSEREMANDPITREMRTLVTAHRAMTLHAIDRAERLVERIKGKVASDELAFVLCHNDIHPGNLLVEAPTLQARLFVVDWDYPIFAPKERDLMFIGGGQGFMPYEMPDGNQRELELFYAAYGDVEIDAAALAYYRYERGIYDIAVDVERIYSPTLSDQDRAQSLVFLGYYFMPGCPLEMARRVDVA